MVDECLLEFITIDLSDNWDLIQIGFSLQALILNDLGDKYNQVYKLSLQILLRLSCFLQLMHLQLAIIRREIVIERYHFVVLFKVQNLNHFF